MFRRGAGYGVPIETTEALYAELMRRLPRPPAEAQEGASVIAKIDIDEEFGLAEDLIYQGFNEDELSLVHQGINALRNLLIRGAHKLDTESQVFFYEQEFYVLSNFSAFNLYWRGIRFHTSEAAYHWEKFPDHPNIQFAIQDAPSAHEAFKIAERHKAARRPDWDAVKRDIMLNILRAKTEQHEYVRRKLLETGMRELVEDSWRDDFWGWGSDRKGQNWLGKLWMRVRSELRQPPAGDGKESR